MFDSIQSCTPASQAYDLSEDPMLLDESFQQKLLQKIAAASLAGERAMGGDPQDIEGAIVIGSGKEMQLVVLQARPQV